MPTEILIILALAVCELILSSMFIGSYFRYGIPIFSSRISLDPGKKTPTCEEMVGHTKSSIFVDLMFRSIGPHEFGFREKIWGSFSNITYTPVMRGYIVRSSDHVQVVGYLNYFMAIFLPFFIYKSHSFSSGSATLIGFTIFPIALVAGIYAIQRKRFMKLVREIESHSDSAPKT